MEQNESTLLAYWRKRCLLAEACMEASPCDPDITPEQCQAHANYNLFIRDHSIEEE